MYQLRIGLLRQIRPEYSFRQFSFQFQFGNPSEVQLTKALICTRKQNPGGGGGGRCISGSGSGSSSSSSSGGKTTSSFQMAINCRLDRNSAATEMRAARNITVSYFQRCTRLRLPLIGLMVTSIYFRHQLILIFQRIMALNMRTILLWLQVAS